MVNFNLDFKAFGKNKGILVKTMRVGCVQIEIKMKEKKEKNSLKSQATGLGSLGQPTCARVFILTLGSMTYSHFPNRIFI